MKTLGNWLKNNPSLSLLCAACLALGVHATAAAPAPQGISGFAPAGNPLVPFVVEIPAGLANSAGVGSANPEILIDSDGDDGYFLVNSILLKSNVPSTGFLALSVNSVTLNGTEFDTRTYSVVDFVDGSGVDHSADLMGMPTRQTSVSDTDRATGGNFPNELIAENAGTSNIEIRMFARSDDSDLSVDTVRVSGWKKPGDNISVSYVPGN